MDGLPREVRLTGSWHCRYGNFAIVEFLSTGVGYSIRAASKVVIGNTRFELPPGTVLGDVRHAGGGRYEGRHAMYQLANGAFGRWSTMAVTLQNSGWRLAGSIFDLHGVIAITFDRIGAPAV
ncbi:hypothetical protein KZZ52_34960 [Dactylosporangium sp. AC04546]|uniref:hypothetical protein n=1 Tax=Dactylosporangium sp. AC04546 TaxID=2862460 RepID=UPI001EE05CC0|nr:hypothetical protein [Dactylosporangium sp. AC04546]WVK79171.1 hypothetical protein KZZ52_34960 [Dactylosporangium sp. AC04546]